MSRGSNDFFRPPWNRRPGQDSAGPRFHPFWHAPPNPRVRVVFDPWSSFEERESTGPFDLARFNIGLRNTQAAAASAIPEDESMLTRDEQSAALQKLKKQIYNPGPKRIARRLCLYYRENARNNTNDMEKEIDDDGKRCAVCLDDFEPQEVVVVTPCSHMFHEECIVPWVKNHGKCPVCRFAICERMREGPANNNPVNAGPGDPFFAGDLITIMRTMDALFE